MKGDDQKGEENQSHWEEKESSGKLDRKRRGALLNNLERRENTRVS